MKLKRKVQVLVRTALVHVQHWVIGLQHTSDLLQRHARPLSPFQPFHQDLSKWGYLDGLKRGQCQFESPGKNFYQLTKLPSGPQLTLALINRVASKCWRHQGPAQKLVRRQGPPSHCCPSHHTLSGCNGGGHLNSCTGPRV